jgi:hypothetical protein
VSRFLVAALAAAFLAGPVLADAPVPVRARVMKGARGGAANFDERLADLKGQLSRLAYVRWEQTSEHRMDMRQGRTEFVELPGGDMIALTIMEVRGPTVTFEVGITQRNTQSRLTIEKGQKIVHQVTGERDGAAYFVAVMPWP